MEFQANAPKVLEDQSLSEEEYSPRFASHDFLVKRNFRLEQSNWVTNRNALDTQINTSKFASSSFPYSPLTEISYDDPFDIQFPFRIEESHLYTLAKSINPLQTQISISLKLKLCSTAQILFKLSEEGQETEETLIIQFQSKADRVTMAILFPNLQDGEYVYYKRRELISGDSLRLENSIEMIIWDNGTSILQGKVNLNGFEDLFQFNNCIMATNKSWRIGFSSVKGNYSLQSFSCKYFSNNDFLQAFSDSNCHCNCSIF